MKKYLNRRLWFWKLVGYWSIIRQHHRVVLYLVLLGTVASLVISAVTTPVFSSRAIIDVEGECAKGCKLIHVHSLKPQHYKPEANIGSY